MKLINKDTLLSEIEKLKGKVDDNSSYSSGWKHSLRMLEIFLEEVEPAVEESTWRPSKEQMKAFKQLLYYNIGVFDYGKFMTVTSLYDELTALSDTNNKE